MNDRTRLRWKRFGLGVSAGFTLLVVFVMNIPLLFAPANTARSDVILHLASDARLQGDEYVARLYKERLAARVVCASSQISWDVYPSDASCAHLIELGVPAEAVSVLHLPMTDCGAEVVPILIEDLRALGARSVLFVVDPTVTRYGEWRSRHRFAAAGIEARTTFAPQDREVMLDRWWRSHWKAQRIVGTLMNTTIDLLYAPCR
ncbi:MAG: hypothetical protein ABI882_18785 [Acidobacteriota bacterium]